MINELLAAKKITEWEHDLYMLFHVNELGRKCMDIMLENSLMDEPAGTDFNGVKFAFYDGRRSVLRMIHRAIINVNIAIREQQNA